MYVGRSSKWGNPFKVGPLYSQEKAVEIYTAWLKGELRSRDRIQGTELAKTIKQELKGKDLVCWCTPKSCHADILIEIANKEE